MDKGSQHELTLCRMPQGGYVVVNHGGAGQMINSLMASTSIDEALKFMRDMIQPVGGAQRGDGP